MTEKKFSLFEGQRRAFVFLFIASSFVNVLVLTSPFFMLLLYDLVVPSGSIPTLTVLTVLAIIFFIFLGLFDYLRGRVMSRIGAQLQTKFDEVFLVQVNRAGDSKQAQQALNDLSRLQAFFSSPVSIAAIDVLWSPLFVVVAFIFHPALGWFTLGAVAILVTVAIFNFRSNRAQLEEAQRQNLNSEYFAKEYSTNAEVITALGMQKRLADRWMLAREKATINKLGSADKVGLFSSFSKTLRMVAQSGILALGALLAVAQKIPAGMMISGSILLGRTLAPIDQIIGQWGVVAESIKSYQNVRNIAKNLPPEVKKTDLPTPLGAVKFSGVYATYGDPRTPILNNVNFEIMPGHALGIIGPSASGKTSLARVLLGSLPVLRGRVDIDGASLEQYDEEKLGSYFGYLPQEVALLTGTISENIARFDQSEGRDERVIAAAKSAGAHEMIIELKDGYDTKLPGALSGGQKQRVALARALYGDPKILVFDEPNSNLDSEGTNFLNVAIESAKRNSQTVLIIAHRPAAIQQCDYLLVIRNGTVVEFGPRDEVLKKQVKNYQVIQGASNAD